jgi:hypothetical protein
VNRSTRYLNLPPGALRRSLSQPLVTLWMLILFDHVTPKGIARFLIGHTVITAVNAFNSTTSRISSVRLLLRCESAEIYPGRATFFAPIRVSGGSGNPSGIVAMTTKTKAQNRSTLGESP